MGGQYNPYGPNNASRDGAGQAQTTCALAKYLSSNVETYPQAVHVNVQMGFVNNRTGGSFPCTVPFHPAENGWPRACIEKPRRTFTSHVGFRLLSGYEDKPACGPKESHIGEWVITFRQKFQMRGLEPN